jgi:hypothetical protein
MKPPANWVPGFPHNSRVNALHHKRPESNSVQNAGKQHLFGKQHLKNLKRPAAALSSFIFIVRIMREWDKRGAGV